MPFVTCPNTTCRPSSHFALAKVRKNCEPFVPGPELAMDSSPPFWCLTCPPSGHSSAKQRPYMLSPPLPSPWMWSPPWSMNPGMIRWHFTPL